MGQNPLGSPDGSPRLSLSCQMCWTTSRLLNLSSKCNLTLCPCDPPVEVKWVRIRFSCIRPWFPVELVEPYRFNPFGRFNIVWSVHLIRLWPHIVRHVKRPCPLRPLQIYVTNILVGSVVLSLSGGHWQPRAISALCTCCTRITQWMAPSQDPAIISVVNAIATWPSPATIGKAMQ